MHNCKRFAQLQGVRTTETLKISQCPHGRLTICSLFAGRRCLCRGRHRHSVNRELPDLLQHSRLCARSSSKVPIAPIGDSNPRFACCLQGGGVYVSSGTVTITSSSITGNTAYYVCAHVLKFPSPQWETHVLRVVCRAAVSMSFVAQCQS